MEQTINQRLNLLIEALNLNPSSFGKRTSIKDGTLRMYIDRGSKPSSEVLEKIVRAIPNVNAAWLLTGDGEMFVAESKPAPGIGNYQSGSNSNTQAGRDILSPGSPAELVQCQTLLNAVRKLYESRVGEPCPI